jgi:steroid delta-isomerase-like uncharacterized protein
VRPAQDLRAGDRYGEKEDLPMASTEGSKELVRRRVREAANERNLDVLHEVAAAPFARTARRWMSPFRQSFPDFRTEIVDPIAEGDRVVAHFRCSGTHEHDWLGFPATGKRFENVDEIYIFRVEDGRLVAATAVEDNLTRLQQLGLFGRPSGRTNTP